MAVIYGLIFILLAFGNAIASLQQLGDAWADVTTFGAWGQSRDLHNAEMALVAKRYEEELARARNISEASIATTRIEEKLKAALLIRLYAQDTLQIIALADALVAHLRDEIATRYALNRNLTRFAEWFDAFGKGTGEKIEELAKLLQAASTLDENNIRMVEETLKLERSNRDRDFSKARAHLSAAIKESNWSSLEKAVSAVVEIRRRLLELVEKYRQDLLRLIGEMDAEDVKRRRLCDTKIVAVMCNGKECRYYSPISNPPCGALTYLNIFPVAPFKKLFDRLPEMRRNAEFFIAIGRIGEIGEISETKFSSPEQVFGENIQIEALVPEPFRIPQTCVDLNAKKRRMFEALDYIGMFTQAEFTAKSMSNINALLSARPMIEFSLDGLLLLVPAQARCQDINKPTLARLKLLDEAIQGAETFGDALTFRNVALLESADTLAPVLKFGNDF